ncbi:MAG: hypothetical protein WCF24_03400 [Acidimicrobiales bacterium]
MKCKEAALVFAEGFSTADFLHGPIASVADGFPALVIDGDGATHTDAPEFVDLANRTGASVAIASIDADSSLRLPESLPEVFQPIAATVRD